MPKKTNNRKRIKHDPQAESARAEFGLTNRTSDVKEQINDEKKETSPNTKK